MYFTLETLLGCIGLLSCDHLDEAEAARLLGVRVTHDVALLDLSVLFKETRHLLFTERGMDTGDEEVGAGVAAALVILAWLWWWAAAVPAIGGSAAGARVLNIATVSSGRPAAVALVATRLVVVAALIVLVLHCVVQ